MTDNEGARSDPGSRSAAAAVSAAARVQFAIGLLFAASFFFFGIWARFRVPYRDDWDWLLFLFDHRRSPAAWLYPHNEHVIIVARGLLALQYALDGAAGRLLSACGLASESLVAWMFWRETRRRWPGSLGLFVWGAIAVLLFSTFQLQSVVFGAAILFPLVQLWAVLAFVAALNATEPGASRRRWLGAAAAAAGLASLTTTNGLVVPLIVAALLWARGERSSPVPGFAASTIVGLAVYLRFVAPPASSPVPVPGAGAMAGFLLAFFGTALGYASVPLAIGVGAVIGLTCLAAVGQTVVRPKDATRIELFAVAVIAFASASAVMAVPGRAGFGAIQAAQSRYTTFSLACWSALFVWLLSAAERRGWNWRRPCLMRGLAAACCVALPVHLFIGFVWRLKADNIAAAMLAVRSGVHDEAWVATLHPVTATVYEGAVRLRAAGDRSVVDARMGDSVPGLAPLPSCDGEFRWTRVDADGWRLEGRVRTERRAGVIVDRSRVVRGLAQRAPYVTVPAPPETEFVRQAWAYVRGTRHEDTWLGFTANGEGAPYKLVVQERDGGTQCSVTLDPPPLASSSGVTPP